MKKIITLILSLVMLFALCACGSSDSPAESTAPTASGAAPAESAAPADNVADNNETEQFVFKQGFDLDYPPYSYIQDDGSIGGLDVEMTQALCEYMGWGYEAVPFNWDAKDAELNAGSCDCIWSGFTVEGREDNYVWSMPYSRNIQCILVADDSGITTLADLAGKIVGVQTSTSAYDLLQDGQAELAASFADLQVYETYTIAFNDLQAGAIDAIAIDITAGTFLMEGTTGYGFLEETIGEENYAIGFRLGDEALRDQVNEGLQALVDNGTFDEIGQKYPDVYDYLCLGK